MPYGVKQGIRTPGEFGVADYAGLSLAGAAGIVAALVTDYNQSGEAAAIYTINRWVVAFGSIMGLGDIPLYMVALGLIVAGAASIFYFQPITRQGAFAQGFGMLAVMMTAIPADLAGGIEAMNEDLPGLQPISSTTEAFVTDGEGQIIKASFAPSDVKMVPAQYGGAGARYDVEITVNFIGGIPSNIDSLIRRGGIRGRLHNEDTNQTYNIFRTAGGTISRRGDSLIIRAGVPARSETATLWVRIECSNNRIEQQSAVAKLGERLDWSVDLVPSATPLFFQRLRQSYWF